MEKQSSAPLFFDQLLPLSRLWHVKENVIVVGLSRFLTGSSCQL
jgi:hypothetical protein